MAKEDITVSGFGSDLVRYKRFWQTGLFLRDVLSLCGLAVVLFAVCGLLDFFMAFGTAVRVVLDCAIGVVLLVLSFVRLVRIFKLNDRDMAIRADDLLAGRRRSILSAHELTAELAGKTDATPEMHVFLLQSSIRQSAGQLKKLSIRDYFPIRAVGVQFMVLVCQVVLVGSIMLLNWQASLTIAKRFIYPLRDVPPYSRYAFEINPDTPQVIYGSDIEISVNITGAALSSPVWLMTQYDGRIHKAACFQESGTKYAQRLEKVVSEVEFCFATGHARSRWHKIDLLMQPKIALASAVIAPPAYTRLPTRQLYIGNDDLAVYRLAKINLTITSNRPLLDGLLTIRPRDGLGSDELVKSERVNEKSLFFEWAARGEADLEIIIRDVRGTAGRHPLRVVQKISADNPPEAVIDEPAEFVLATPAVSIPLRGYAEDDLALSRVELVKTVVGYRDRIRMLGPDAPVKRLNFDSMLDMKRLGVQPGQVLEFYLEACDLNPDLMGIAASPVVRVQIISEEEYAQMLRTKERQEDFMKRYYLLADEISKLRDALKELKKAAESGETSAEDLKKAQDDAIAAAEHAAETGKKMAEDFPIYEMETSLASLARDVAGMGEEMKDKLQQSGGSRATIAVNATAMLRALGEKEQEMNEQKADAQELDMLYQVMECSGRFMELYRRQSELVNRLQRFERETQGKDLRLLASLGKRQEELRIDLETLAADIRERAGKLTNVYNALKNTALEFADLIDALEIPPVMTKAVGHAANQDGRQTLHFSTLALEKMEQLLSESKDGDFCGMCNGQIKFQVPKEIMMTLNQMMLAMSGGRGSGAGTFGGGAGGDASDGYSMGGYSPVNTPTFGPSRMSMGSEDGGTDSGPGVKGSKAVHLKVDEMEKMDIRNKSKVEGEALPMENVPDKYREAVKKYFSEE